ncbi:hypothetical protein D9M70_544800 [compost metagenome]
MERASVRLYWVNTWPTGRNSSLTSMPGVLAFTASTGLIAPEMPKPLNRLSPQATTWSPTRALSGWSFSCQVP